MSDTTNRSFADPLARWNERFSAQGYLFGEEPNAYLASQAQHLRPGSALSVADGEGRNSVWLAGRGLRVEAFDFSPVAVDKARALAQRHGVQVALHCATWQDFTWKQAAYDNVVGIFFQFADPADRTDLFQRMDAALRPGGVLLIQGYGKEQMRFGTGGPGKLDHLYDEALLREAFPAYEVLDLRTYEAQVNEGSGHQGMSALVGFVARKPA